VTVLILLPASDAKAPVGHGRPVDPTRLSFARLGPTREAVLAALVATSSAPDALRRLGVGPSRLEQVRANVDVRDAPAAPAAAVYGGVLYGALDWADLDPAARRRARSWIVVVSALWGAVRAGDRIPPYRLDMCGRLPGLGHLPDVWRRPLGDVLPRAARRGLVVDCRSSDYLTAWRPSGDLAERTLLVRVVRGRDDVRSPGSHRAKRARGLLTRRIVGDAIDPDRPEELVAELAGALDVTVRPPDRPGRCWSLLVVDPGD
jgi:cytoplasmic iron level regulating protein YaaA (DUF328/UPF0246 family)